MRLHLCDAFMIFYGMDKTSMSNSIKKRLNRKGFTLAEVLVTVAIILILAGVTFVSVVQYQKNLRLMEMDGTAKEIFIAAQNHLSVAQASGDLDRLAEKAKSATGTTDSTIGTKLDPSLVSAYAGDTTSGEYYYVIHNATSGIESCTPSGSGAILQMMLPFGALDETVATGGNYAIVYELKSASVVAVLYSGAGNASFGNAAVINFSDDNVSNINKIYNDKSKRKSYEKNGVTAIVGCYTGTAGSAAIPTETLEAPKLEVKNENKLHVLVREARNTDNITLVITGEQSGTTARRLLNRDVGAGDGYESGTGTFDVTLDDITGDGKYRFSQLIHEGRFKPDIVGSDFIPGENIIISAIASSTTALATAKESAKYTVSSLFDDVNETTNSTGDTRIYIKNLRHLENLGANVSGFTAELRKDATSGHYSVVNITAVQKNDITMFSFEGLRDAEYKHIYGSGTNAGMYTAANVNYPLSYDGGSHEIFDLFISSYSGGNVTELNAGIFGNVTDKLSVKNLILRNDKIPEKASATNAGMLLGKTSADLTVDGVLAYYHEENYNADNDSKVEVVATTDNGVAGGLIGFVSDGMLNVKNSAAAVYVKGRSAAGGLIGSVSGADAGSTIVQSYAGGHTKDGAYSTTDATTNKPVLGGAGRYNVQATQASGYAGGFIGVTTNKVEMNAVYSTASAYASSGAANAGSFAGKGTLNIQKTTDGKENYYAIGPHNGTDASADDTAKAEIKTGQVRRQATPYDRKLLKDDASEQTMKKMTYPLCTISHMCSDINLPWFIKEHVGDWVVSKKTEESNFEVENGNRLTVRIRTGRSSITEDLYYAVKVHEETMINNQDDAYFLLHVNSDNTVTVKLKFNNEGWSEYNHNIAICKMNTESSLVVELYLDDITNPYGHFGMIFDGNKFIPGEDISINVIPLTNENDKNVTYDETQKIYTNSLFGYLQNGTEYSSDDHNKRKIDAVKSYDSEAGTQENGEGLIPALNDKYYVQIDNSRHLENLSYSIGYSWPDTIGQKIVGAIQTDNIYWSGETNQGAYTQSIQKELGENLSVWSRNAPYNPKTSNGCFSPLDYNQSMTFYDGGNYFVDGLKVNETRSSASLFIMPDSTEMMIKNLTIKNSSFISSERAACLISYTANKLTVENTHCKNVIVNGTTAAGGLVGQANGTVSITNCSVNGNITSQNEQAGGFVGYTGKDVTIESASCDGVLTVSGYNSSGGLIGQTNQSKITVDAAKFLSKVEVTSETTHAGGVIGISGGEAEIKNTTFNKGEGVFVSGANSSGGIIGNANGKATVDQVTFESDVMVKATSANVHAGGIVGYANGEAEIKNTTFNGCLTVSGENSSAGIIGNAGAKATVNVANFQSDVTVTSNKEHAAGVLGITNNEADIKNVTFSGKLNVCGKNSSGGILGSTGSKLKLWNISIGGPSTITSDPGNAGGIVGYAQSYDADIKNVKFIGKDTEVIAKQNAGGLCGTLTGNSILNISNVTVSAFIQAEENAGGLIGQLNTEANEGKLKNSYYGGRTYYGQYGPITINHNEKPYTYTSNIHGNKKAGGLIGYIENANGLTISQCFSTGSVENSSNNQTAGGFIGVATPWSSGVKITNCYSMGNVSGTNNGGFIGNKNEKVIFDEGVYYLKVFNETIPAIGTTSTGDNSKLIVLDLVDAIKGTKDSKDLSEETMPYDETLNEKVYPYKNWTTDWESKETSKPIAYYGDWPSPKPLTGEFIYFHAVNTSSFNKRGDTFKLTGEKTNAECFLNPASDNMSLEEIGFGIISDVVIQDDVSYNAIKRLYSWSLTPNIPDETDKDHLCNIAGSANEIKYSEFNYYGKKYYYYRCTTEELKQMEKGTVYVRNNTTRAIYKISVIGGKATFERI